MRGSDGMQEALFTMSKLEDFVPSDHPLRAIQMLVNEPLGKYKACHGPGWNKASHDYCAKADYYLLSVQKPHPTGGFEVVQEVKIPAERVTTRDWLVFERKMVVANEQTNEICYRATEPPTCFIAK